MRFPFCIYLSQIVHYIWFTCTHAIYNSISILFTFYPFITPWGTNGTSWGTNYCVCPKKAVPLHQIWTTKAWRSGWSRNGREKGGNMIAEMIIPIDTLRGQLRKDGYYFRMYKGKQIVQRCPNRKEHVKTANEQANQERFIKRYRKKRKPA